MPRARSVVMDQHDPAKLRAHAHRRAVELAEPYRVYSPKQRGAKKSEGYAVIYVPTDGKRELIMEGLDKDTAKQLRSMLEDAWVAGRVSAMLD